MADGIRRIWHQRRACTGRFPTLTKTRSRRQPGAIRLRRTRLAGGATARKNHRGRLKVRLRLKGPSASTGGVPGVNDWIDDLRTQLATYDRNLPSQDFRLTIQLPAIFRANAEEDLPWEVMVDW